MKFKAQVKVMLKPSVLDPQGAALQRALKSMGHAKAGDVRVGKLVEIALEEENAKKAEALVAAWADELLANPVMENYSFTVEPAA